VLASLEMQRTLYPHPKGDIRATMTLPEETEELQKVTLDDAKKFYQGFVGASNAELAVVGDFDAQKSGSSHRTFRNMEESRTVRSGDRSLPKDHSGQYQHRDARQAETRCSWRESGLVQQQRSGLSGDGAGEFHVGWGIH